MILQHDGGHINIYGKVTNSLVLSMKKTMHIHSAEKDNAWAYRDEEIF